MFEPLIAALRDGETIVRFGTANLRQVFHIGKYFRQNILVFQNRVKFAL